MWSVAPAEGLDVLAFDENNQAAAWVKNYGGEPGTGFVMLGYGAGAIEPAVVRAVSLYRPGRSRE
jgi:hypothetical protein